jgi:hypothetical protein
MELPFGLQVHQLVVLLITAGMIGRLLIDYVRGQNDIVGLCRLSSTGAFMIVLVLVIFPQLLTVSLIRPLVAAPLVSLFTQGYLYRRNKRMYRLTIERYADSEVDESESLFAFNSDMLKEQRYMMVGVGLFIYLLTLAGI